MKERHFSACVAEVGQRNGNTALPPTLPVATSGYGRLRCSDSSGGGDSGWARRSRCSAAGDESAAAPGRRSLGLSA